MYLLGSIRRTEENIHCERLIWEKNNNRLFWYFYSFQTIYFSGTYGQPTTDEKYWLWYFFDLPHDSCVSYVIFQVSFQFSEAPLRRVFQ